MACVARQFKVEIAVIDGLQPLVAAAASAVADAADRALLILIVVITHFAIYGASLTGGVEYRCRDCLLREQLDARTQSKLTVAPWRLARGLFILNLPQPSDLPVGLAR